MNLGQGDITAAMGMAHRTGGWNIPIIFIFVWFLAICYIIFRRHMLPPLQGWESVLSLKISLSIQRETICIALVRCMGPKLWLEPLWQPSNLDLYVGLTNPLHEIEVYVCAICFFLFLCLKIGFMGFLLFRGIWNWTRSAMPAQLKSSISLVLAYLNREALCQT